MGRMLGGSESRAGSSAGKDDVRNAGSAAEDGEDAGGEVARWEIPAELNLAAGPARKAGITTTSARMNSTMAKIVHPKTTRLIFIGPPWGKTGVYPDPLLVRVIFRDLLYY